MLITIIGAGNVAHHLALALEKKGQSVEEVYSRELADAKLLARQLYNAHPQDHLDFSESNSKVFLIAVSDTAIETIAEEMVLPDNAVIVHTAGTIPMEVLEKTATEHIGVFYPLQTFTRGEQANFDNVPILIEYSTPYSGEILERLGNALSKNVAQFDHEDRRAIHLAAVFANNFTNHVLGAAEQVLREKGINRSILRPLVEETVRKFFKLGAGAAQTGPASRRDLPTIQTHKDLLTEEPDLQFLYNTLTQSIIEQIDRED